MNIIKCFKMFSPLDSPGQEQHPAQLIELLRKLQKDGLAAEFFIKILQVFPGSQFCRTDFFI